MEIPRVPKIAVPNVVAPNKINAERLPSISLLGTPASEYQNFQNAQQRRKSWFFDTNKPGQVNSLADVVVNTAANLTKLGSPAMTVGGVLQNLVDDSKALVYHGTIQPIMNRDWKALRHNAFVNVIETIDIVDNLYKGFMIEYWPNKDIEAGKRGFQRAFYGRENYNFNTGNGFNDLILEMATPTNVALLGLAGATSLAGKAVGKEATTSLATTYGDDLLSKLTPKVLKAFSREYKGDAIKTIAALQKTMNLNATQIAMLEDISKHVTSVRILSAINKTKVPIQIVDSIGPKLTFYSAVFPLWQTTKYGVQGLSTQYKYAANLFERTFKYPTVISFASDHGEYVKLAATMTAVAELTNEKIVIEALPETISRIAGQERKALVEAYNSALKNLNDDKLIRRLASEHAESTGKLISFVEAKDIHVANILGELDSILDAVAVKLSQGQLDNFDDYVAAISKVYNSTSYGAGIGDLYHLARNLQEKKITGFRYKLANDMYKYAELFSQEIKRHKEIMDGVVEAEKLDIKEIIKETELDMQFVRQGYLDLKNRAATAVIPEEKARLTQALESFKTKQGIVDGPGGIKLPKYTQELEELQRLLTPLEPGEFLKYRSPNLAEHLVAEQREITNAMREQLLSFSNTLAEVGSRIDIEHADQFKQYTEQINKYFGELEFINNSALVSNDAIYGSTLVDLGDEIASSMKTMADQIVETFRVPTSREALERYVKRLHGVATKDIVEQLASSKGVTRKSTMERIVNDNFVKDNSIDAPAIRSFLDEVHEAAIKVPSEMQQIVDTMGGIEFEYAEALVRLNDNLTVLDQLLEHKTLTSNILADKLDDMVVDLHNIKYNAEQSLQAVVEYLTKTGVSPEVITDDILLFRNKIDAIDNILDKLAVSETQLIKLSDENIKVYQAQLSAIYRNATIMSTDSVQEMLDMIEFGTYNPALATVRSLATLDLGQLDSLIVFIDQGKMVEANTIYKKITGMDLTNPQAVTALFNEVKELQTAARTIFSTLEGMVSARKLIELTTRKAETEIGWEVAHHFLDALQSMYDRPASLATYNRTASGFAEELNQWVWAIKHNVNQQLRNKNLKYNFRLENMGDYVETLVREGKMDAKYLDEYHRLFPESASHFAGADAYMDFLVNRHLLESKGMTNAKVVHIDLETSTVNKFGAHIHQYSMVIPETNEVMVFVNTKVPLDETLINDNLYYKLFDNSYTKSLDELKELYTDIHRNGNVERLRTHFGFADDVKLIPCLDEEDVLRQANAKLKELSPENGKLKLSMYNGHDYDVNVINNRLKLYELDDMSIDKYSVIDNRKELEKMFGVRTLTRAEEKAIEDMIHEYIGIRDVELLRIARTNGLEDTLYGRDEALRKFLPTVDDSFRDALERVETYFGNGYADPVVRQDPITNNYKFHELVQHTDEDIQHSMKQLQLFRSDINTSLRTLKEVQKELNEFTMSTALKNPDGTVAARLIDDSFWTDKNGKPIFEGITSKGNIMVEMSQLHREAGVMLPIINVKTIADHNLVATWFKVEGKPLSDVQVRKMTDLGRKLERTIDRIKYPDLIATYANELNFERAIDELRYFQRELLAGIKEMTGTHYFSPIIADFKSVDNLLAQYAMTRETYNVYARMAQDLKLDRIVEGDLKGLTLLEKKLKTFSPELWENVMNPSTLWSTRTMKEVDDAKFHKLNVSEGDLSKVIAYVKGKAEMSVKTLHALEQLQEKTVNVAKLKHMVPIYEPMLKSLDIIEKAAEAMGDKSKEAYAHMRIPLEMADAYVAYNKLRYVLQQSPEDLASYLWHYGKGEITFKLTDLNSASYFKNRNNVANFDILQDTSLIDVWQNIMKNKKNYLAKGIDIEILGGRVSMSLDADMIDVFKELPLKPIEVDFDFTEVMRDYLTSNNTSQFLRENNLLQTVYDALEAIQEARRHMLRLAPEGNTSTLEKLDSSVFDRLRYNMGFTKNNKIDLDTLLNNSRFDGNPFNHSVLGAIDSRRELMEFSSFNPAKRMFHSMEFLHSRIATQTQYIELLFAEDSMLKNVARDMSNQDIFNYLQDKKHLRVAFLQEDKKKGFKLSRINIFSPKDIDFAMQMNAVVLDNGTFTKAYEVINRNRIPEGFLKWIDRTLVAPFKLGWMAYNLATVSRNLIDSGMKNIYETGDYKIIPRMHQMFGHYADYKRASQAILEIAKSENKTPKTAVELYFSRGNVVIDREIYDLITFFKQSGSSSGMVREVQKYYGDAIDRLFRKVGGEQVGVTSKEFRELIRMNDVTARAWLDNKFLSDKTTIETLMAAKNDFYVFKRAYAMHKNYNGQVLTVDSIVTALRRPELIETFDETTQQQFRQLLDKTKDLRYTETLFEKAMSHPIIDNALTLHAGVEEVLRLALYSYLIENGTTTSEALSKVIKTHFDYGHKTQAQMYLEMIMPFSTFRFNSILFWTEQMGKSNTGMEFIAKYAGHAANMEERDIDDIILRRGLQYQMYTGNLVINQQTGTTLKVNPSAMDTLKFFNNPLEYISGAFHSLAGSVHNYITMERYENERPDDFNARKYKAAMQLIPLVGSHLARLKADPDRHPVLNLLLAPFINRTWTPAQRGFKLGKHYTNRRLPRPRRARFRRYYPKKSQYMKTTPYSPFERIYHSAMFNTRYRNVNVSRTFRTINRWHQETWKRTLSPRGKSKFQLLTFPTNKWTLRIKTELLRQMVHR